ncbi:MAG: PAS domain S-box protein [Thermodesulfobacteriota bacterium]|nr:PAS domain S-box protein [Thermodesulfobacteriota bacterium]
MFDKLFERYVAELKGRESSLYDSFLSHAVEFGYGEHFKSHSDPWKTIFTDMVHDLAQRLEMHDAGAPLKPISGGKQFVMDSPGRMGLVVAGKIRKTGLQFGDCVALIKFLRLVFVDLYNELYADTDNRESGLSVLNRYFNRLEIRLFTEWVRMEKSKNHMKLKEANLFILREKRRYFTIFHRMHEPSLIVGRDLKIVDVNQTFKDFFGIKEKDVVGKECSDIFGKDVCVECGLEAALEAQTSFLNLRCVTSVQGEEKTVMFGGTFLGDINGEYSGNIIIIQDITERMTFEKELVASEEKYRSLVENVPDVTWRADQNGNFVYISPNVESVCGFIPSEMLELMSKFSRIHQEDSAQVAKEFSRLFYQVAESRNYPESGKFDVRYRFRKKDGEWIWIHDRAGIVHEKDGTLMVDGVFFDITELKKVEEELEEYSSHLSELMDERTSELLKSNKLLKMEIAERRMAEDELKRLTGRLENSNAELEHFAHIASHDLKEPLLLINAFAERLMNRHAGELSPRGCNYLERIIRSARKMEQLINAQLDLSRITACDRPFEPINLNVLMAEVVDDLEEQINKTGGRVDIGHLTAMEGDRIQIRQLFQNVIINALKYSREWSEPHVRISGRLIKGSTMVEIMVEDNGIGFDEKYLDRIFRPFERLHSWGEYEGTGMGLATCEKIVLRHGGEITARSTPGVGSTFYIRLPRGSNVCTNSS